VSLQNQNHLKNYQGISIIACPLRTRNDINEKEIRKKNVKSVNVNERKKMNLAAIGKINEKVVRDPGPPKQ